MASKSHGVHGKQDKYEEERDERRERQDEERKQEDAGRKKYEAAARATPIGTVVWYWSAPNAEPQAALLAGRDADGEHCNLLVISALGVASGRQNVRQAKSGDRGEGEYFQEIGAAPLEVPEVEELPATDATTDTTKQKVA